MAKVNPVKLKQDADRLEKAGRLEQSIALYRQIVEDSPRDWNTINKVGDLLAKLNKFQEANEEYAKVADFYAKDGFHLKAIAIWKKINKLDPAALGPYVNLAELYAKQGLMMEAKGQYQIVVEEYIKRGKMRDAGEILRKMAEIDPGDLKVRSKLADLYTREGNVARAVEEHVAIAEELSKKAHLAEAVQVLEKGLKIDPRSMRLRVELGRVHIVQKSYERALQTLEEAARLGPNDPQVLARLGEAYLGAGRIDEAQVAYQRLLELNADDGEARAQMGRVRIARREFDRALEEFLPLVERFVARREGDGAAALLQEIVQREPGHVKTLVKLAEVHRLLKHDSSVVATYSLLTEAYLQAGQYDQAMGVLETLISMEPYSQQHKTKLQFVRDKRAGAGSAPPPAAAYVDLEEEFDQPASEAEFPGLGLPERAPARPAPLTPVAVPVVSVSPAAGRMRPSVERSGPLSEQDQEFVDEHLAEGKVFRKYGLIDKAADQFEAIVARFPDHAEARHELAEIYKEKGQLAQAAEQALALAEICRQKGDSAGAAAHEALALELAPPPEPARPAAAPARPRAATPSADEVEEIPLVVEEGGEEEEPVSFALEEEGAEAEELPARFLEDEPQAPAPAAQEAELDLSFAEPGEAPPPAAAPAGEDEAFPLDTGPAGFAVEEGGAFALPGVGVERALAAARAAAAPAAPAVPADLRRVLDEVDEYMSLGFVDDARAALGEIAQRHTGHPLVLDKLAELGMQAEGAEAARELPLVTDSVTLPAPVSRDAPPARPKVAGPVALPAAPPDQAPALFEADLDLDLPPPAGTPLSAFADELEFPGLEEPEAPEEPASEAAPVPFEDALAGQTLTEPEAPPQAAGGAPAPAETEWPLHDLEAAVSAGGAADAAAIDLGAELFGAVAAAEEPARAPAELGDASLADIFREFKKGVDRQLGQEDYDTRYNLGIAYKEMGLIDEAIAEFQLAAKDPARLLECSSMLGICFIEKGMPKLAIKWFEKGLQAPGRSEEEYQGLRYDLACAWEADGDTERARGLFAELFGQDAHFRDVAEKLRALSGRSRR